MELRSSFIIRREFYSHPFQIFSFPRSNAPVVQFRWPKAARSCLYLERLGIFRLSLERYYLPVHHTIHRTHEFIHSAMSQMTKERSFSFRVRPYVSHRGVGHFGLSSSPSIALRIAVEFVLFVGTFLGINLHCTALLLQGQGSSLFISSLDKYR